MKLRSYRHAASGCRLQAAGSFTVSTLCLWFMAFGSHITLPLAAQDIHFSQFFNAPYSLSPGNIGAFDGQYRVGGIFRQQWRSVTTPYRTFGLGGDAADVGGVRGLGGGAWLYNDRAGDSHLNTFHLSLGASWTKKFGTALDQSLTGGIQLGFTSVTIDYSALRFDAQYNGFYYDPSLPTDEQFTRNGLSHPDVHAGLVYRYTPSKRDLIQVGLSLFNLTRPNVAFNDAVASPLDMRNVFHVITRFPVSTKVDVQPMLQYMGQAKFRELDLGGTVRYILLDRYAYLRTVQAGLFWRASDAGYVFVGSEYDDWTVGLSYDINFSDLVPASRNRGGIELTAVRVFRKKPMVPARFKACPTQL
jgi:type IX secretion system PorP/SprF family membrane protein